MTLHASLDWQPFPWTPPDGSTDETPKAAATFTFYEDDTTPDAWYIHIETFSARDRTIGNEQIEVFVREQFAVAGAIYGRVVALRAVADGLANEGRTEHDGIWREVSCTNVVNTAEAAGIVVTLSWFADAETETPLWTPEPKVFNAKDPAVDAAQLSREIDNRTAFIAEAYGRSQQLVGRLGIPLGVRFPIGGG